MPFHSTTIFTLTHLVPLPLAHLPQQKHHLNLLSSITIASLTHTLASFWGKQSCNILLLFNLYSCPKQCFIFYIARQYSHLHRRSLDTFIIIINIIISIIIIISSSSSRSSSSSIINIIIIIIIVIINILGSLLSLLLMLLSYLSTIIIKVAVIVSIITIIIICNIYHYICAIQHTLDISRSLLSNSRRKAITYEHRKRWDLGYLCATWGLINVFCVLLSFGPFY